MNPKQMSCAKANRSTIFALSVAGLFLLAPHEAFAQEPPTVIPPGGPPLHDPNAIEWHGWQFYPSVSLSAENSNNFFISPSSKISGWQFGITPTLTAEWSDGIHTTTIYGNFQGLEFPTHNELNSTNGEGTLTQQYAPLRDLNFTLIGDYTHQTFASALTSSIPSPIPFTGTTTLPNGNIVLPNGTIVSPSGQTIGQVGTPISTTPFSIVNPYDQYTATGKVQKLFNDGTVTLGTSLARTNYVNANPVTPNFTNKAFTEDSSFWLGPVIYAYSDGIYNIRTAEQSFVNVTPGTDANSTAYRVIGGISTRQLALLSISAYFGHQGSTGSGNAEGNVYGGALHYNPTLAWTINLNLDETINHASANAGTSNLAITTPSVTPIQIATSDSTAITATTVTTTYLLDPLWTLRALLGYTHVQYLDSSQRDDTWVLDTSLRYELQRNLTLTWEYQFSSIISNRPFTSANRNLISMSASYRF